MPRSRSASIAQYSSRVHDWWSEPVDYTAQVAYFSKRSMAHAIKLGVGIGNGINATIPLLLLLPTIAPDGLTPRIALMSFAALMYTWAWAWCARPWPSRRISVLFIASCDIGIGAVALANPNWLAGFWAFNAFAQISIYILFFDGPKALALHGVWVSVTTTAVAMLASTAAHIGCAVLIARLLAIVVPAVTATLGIQLGIWDLRKDANSSLDDPLTGLLNRRGLNLQMGNLLHTNTIGSTAVAVMVADLDRFKDINDTFGHSAGDEVLIRTARRITAAVAGTALVARTGGDEFVIVDLVDPGRAEHIADEIRYAIAAPANHPATASVGVSCSSREGFTSPAGNPSVYLDAIIAHADRALFDAKRQGGNTTINISPTNEYP